MIEPNEAAARIALAEFEARTSSRKSEQRARRWRFAITAFRILVVLAAGVFLQVSHWQISGAQACGLLLVYLAASLWQEHQTRETVQKLQTELDQLRREIEKV